MVSPITIFASASPGELRVAAAQDGRLVDYAIERQGAPDLVGAVLRGRVTARMPALAGAFVALGGAADGFLPDSAGGAGVTQGAIVAVRVTRAAQGGKGPRLAAVAEPPGDGPLGMIAPGPGALERLQALHPDAAMVVDDTVVLATARATLRRGAMLVARAFDDALEAEVAALAEARGALPGGGIITIEPTAALVAIDLDLAAASVGGQPKTASHTAANTAFIPELVRQIRLRNLGGPIVVDLAGLSPRRRAALGPALAEALAGDPLQPRFLGFSALGLAEILRPRVHPPLHELLTTPHAIGLAALRALARELAADPARAPVLRVAADIGDALLADAAARADIIRRCGRKLLLRVDRALPPRAWRPEGA